MTPLPQNSETHDTTLADTFIMCVAKWYILYYGSPSLGSRPCFFGEKRRGIHYAYAIFKPIETLSPLLYEYVMTTLDSTTRNKMIPYVYNKMDWLCSYVVKEGTRTEICLAHVFKTTFRELMETRIGEGEEMLSPIACESRHIFELGENEGKLNGYFNTACRDLAIDHIISEKVSKEILFEMLGNNEIIEPLIAELEPLLTDDDYDWRILSEKELEQMRKEEQKQ